MLVPWWIRINLHINFHVHISLCLTKHNISCVRNTLQVYKRSASPCWKKTHAESTLLHVNTICFIAGSEGSIQSWASSLSLDSQTDETAVEAIEYMKNFVATLFSDSNAITREQKAAFGKYAQVSVIIIICFRIQRFDTQKSYYWFSGGGWKVMVRPVCKCSKSATQKSAWIYVLQFGSELCNYFVWVRRRWWFWTSKDIDEYVLHFLLRVYVLLNILKEHSIQLTFNYF